MTDDNFIDYMRHNLAYDLAQEGRTETAKDILKLCTIAEGLQDKLFTVVRKSLEMERIKEKEINCECGKDEKGIWKEKVFDRFGCDCP